MSQHLTDLTSSAAQEYWHLTNDKVLLHNAYLGKGFVSSSSLVAAAEQNSGFVSLYQVQHQDKEKEQIWESIRKESFSTLPSRMGAMFLFESKTDMLQAIAKWGFTNRTPLRALVVPNSKMHIGDSRWLHTRAHEWVDAARKYWLGTATNAPLREVIVHGMVYFPDWQEPPFGPL